MVGITPPRKLQTAGLLAYTPAPTIDVVMSDKNLAPSRSSGDRGDTRREMPKSIGLVGIGALLRSGLTGPERPWYEMDIIGEPIMDNQLLWYLSHTGQGMADIGECLDTASRIDAADENS